MNDSTYKHNIDSVSYSQEGEDLLLHRIIGEINYKGFYLDIGAHDPVKFSNTYKFYLAGWSGINIEATPGTCEVFNKIRPLDINLETPVSDKVEDLTFYRFNNPLLNSFSESHVREWDGKQGSKVIDKVRLKTSTINSILKNLNLTRQFFDFLSIDIEGFDIKILKSFDFSRYFVNFIIVEDKPEIEKVFEGDIYNFLSNQGYKLISKLYFSSIYYLDYSSEYGQKVLKHYNINAKPIFCSINTWIGSFVTSLGEILETIPLNSTIILIDENLWQIKNEIAGRKVLPFLEKGGEYWGRPSDDQTAILELERMRGEGAGYLVITSLAFWWLDYYTTWNSYIRSNFSCLIEHEQMIIFKISK